MITNYPIEIEVCVESIAGALAAQNAGAHRLELCASLDQGGLTPSIGLVQAVRSTSSLPVMVMVRPRKGDFCYTAQELDVMLRDIDAIQSAGVCGVVLGALEADGTIDRGALRLLVSAAGSLSKTFHRAFDVVRNPYDAFEELIELGFERVLTSGQRRSAAEGIPLLSELVAQAGDRIVVMPGCGVTEHNAERILRETGAHAIHFSGSCYVPAPRVFEREDIFFSSGGDERISRITSETSVRAICEAARRAAST